MCLVHRLGRGLVGGVCRVLCFCHILLVLGFVSSLRLWWCRRASIRFVCGGLRIVLGIGFFGFLLCLKRFRLCVGWLSFGCLGVGVVGSIFRIGIGVSCLRVLGSMLWRGFVCGFGGSMFLGLLLCLVFGLFGLGGMLRRRICGSLLLLVMVVVGCCYCCWLFGFCFVGVFCCVGLLVLFGWWWGRVCRLGFVWLGVVFWFCPSMMLIGIRMLCWFVCRVGL